MNAETEIQMLMSEYDEAHHAGNGARLASFFLDDGVIIPPGNHKLVGRTSIDNFYSNVSGGSNMNTANMSINIDDKIAYVQGDTDWQTEGETRYLSFVNILRFVDGNWKYVLLTWNTNEGLLREA